jgi:flagellar basal-body rod modification protein FlgD
LHFKEIIMVSATAAGTSGSGTGISSKMKIKTEDFIRMMITQLQNQDPMEPAKNEQLLAQMSQIAQLESSTQLSDSIQSIVLQNSVSNAGAMIGKMVAGKDDRGTDVSGLVNSVRVENNKVLLELDNGKALQLARVTEIAPPRAAAAAS